VVTGESGSGFSLSKEMLLLAPLLGTGLAVSFDAGYFLGIGLRYFSLFSLSEHVVFALAILPPATVFAGLMLATASHTRRVREKFKPTKLSHFVGIVVTGLLVGLLAYIFDDALVTISLVGAIFISYFALHRAKTFLTQATGVFVAAIITAAALGKDAAHIDFNRTPTASISLKPAGEIKGVFIRSGERGVLIYDPKAKAVILKQWDDIAEVRDVLH